MNRFIRLFVLPLVFVAAAAHADGKQWQPANAPKRAKAKADRKIASYQTSNANEYRSSRSAPQKEGTEIKLGVLAGAGLQGESSSSGGNLDVGAAPSVGITADIRAWRYFGLEQDAYFQLNGSTPDVGGSKDSVQGLGSFTTVKGQYQFWLGSMKFTPKAGLGFAYQRRTGKSDSAASSVETSISTMGAYGTVGLEVVPFEKFTLSGDYARSITADTNTKTGVLEQNGDNARFDRIRVGGYYEFLPGMHGGLQFIQRSVSFTQPTLAPGSNSDATYYLRQAQAVFQYDL